MLRGLRHFLTKLEPTLAEAVAALRTVFVLMFLAQCLVAGGLAALLGLLTGGNATSALVSQILLILALLQIPVAVTLAQLTARPGGKGAALAAVLMLGVMLATPAWFLAFAFLIQSSFLYLALLLVVLLNSYAVGFLLCGRYGKVALLPGPKAGLEATRNEKAEEKTLSGRGERKKAKVEKR